MKERRDQGYRDSVNVAVATPTRAQSALVEEAVAIEAESAREAGTLGYMARSMVQATMPHRRTEETRIVRRNGDFTLTMSAPIEGVGLPYGSLPRLMLAWVGAEVMRTCSREVELGPTMSAFLAELGMGRTGGPRGSITRLKDQSLRLFSCAITTHYASTRAFDVETFGLGRARFWWDDPDGAVIGERAAEGSTLRLSEQLFQEIWAAPVPLDTRVLGALKKSPMALDVYAWASYRVHTLNRARAASVTVPWAALRLQFGAGYEDTPTGLRMFRRAFLRELAKVRVVWPAARIESTERGLRLQRSPEALPTRSRQRRRAD